MSDGPACPFPPEKDQPSVHHVDGKCEWHPICPHPVACDRHGCAHPKDSHSEANR